MKLPQGGGCQCGKIRYEISEAPQLVLHMPLHRLSAHQPAPLSHWGSPCQKRPSALLLANREHCSACLRVADSTPGSCAPTARVGSIACRAAV
jgi:hypothetical protein